jgi:integrase
LWGELFAVMTCDRDRALICMYVSSAARASELLGLDIDDIDWSSQLVHVISKGSRLRQAVPLSPESLVFLAKYLAQAGTPRPGERPWRTRRGDARPLTHWAMRRVLQRANERLSTNWTLHDLRHTAASAWTQRCCRVWSSWSRTCARVAAARSTKGGPERSREST